MQFRQKMDGLPCHCIILINNIYFIASAPHIYWHVSMEVNKRYIIQYLCFGSHCLHWKNDYYTKTYMILGNCPTWCTNFFQCIHLFIYSSLHVSSMSCSSSGETDCINTASGKCHFVLVAVSCAGQEFTPDQHTTQPPTRSDNTRSCIDTICFSWWWAWHARNM